ncbi:MAG: YfjI family protein [Limisphaerales bacterium]
MNSPIEPTTTGQPGAFVPESIVPEDFEEGDNASPILQYSPPPIDRLPPPLAEYVAKSAEAIGCDACLVAMPALAACAAAIGDARAVQVKAGWTEFPVVWSLVIAPSGQLKTPAMKAAMHGLEEAQKKAFEQHRLAEAKHKAAVAEWIKRDKKGAEPTPPKLASFYIGDATLESVGVLLDTNPRGLLLARDELSGWLGGFDKYSEGNEAAQWLEFHSGNAVRIDRKGGEKKTIYILRALVSVTGTIQEPVLRNLLTGDDAKHFDNGLAPRFIMAMPPERARQWREAITPPALTRQYADLFCDLLKLAPHIDAETGRREPVTLNFSPEAKTRFVNFVNAHGAEMCAFKSDRLKSAWSKLEGQAARLALVFHCVRESYLPSPGENANTISADTLDAALVWIEWLKNETRRIYYTLTHKGDARQADKLIYFARHNGGSITAAAAARAGAGGRDVAAVEKIMAGLVAAGLAEWHTPEQPKCGRPTRYFRLKITPGQSVNATTCRETDKTPL